MASDPTGIRFRIAADDVRAEITQVGAALRALSVDGIELVPSYPDDAPTPAASGIVLPCKGDCKTMLGVARPAAHLSESRSYRMSMRHGRSIPGAPIE